MTDNPDEVVPTSELGEPYPSEGIDMREMALVVLIDRDRVVRLLPGVGEDGQPVVSQEQAADVLRGVAEQIGRSVEERGHVNPTRAQHEKWQRDDEHAQVNMTLVRAQGMEAARADLLESLDEKTLQQVQEDGFFWQVVEVGVLAGIEAAQQHYMVEHGIDPKTGLPLPPKEDG